MKRFETTLVAPLLVLVAGLVVGPAAGGP